MELQVEFAKNYCSAGSKEASTVSLAKEWDWRPCKQMMRKGLRNSFGDRCALTKMYRKPRKHFVL